MQCQKGNDPETLKSDSVTLPCGVMVAHRILVPFVRVRVFPRQLNGFMNFDMEGGHRDDVFLFAYIHSAQPVSILGWQKFKIYRNIPFKNSQKKATLY